MGGLAAGSFGFGIARDCFLRFGAKQRAFWTFSFVVDRDHGAGLVLHVWITELIVS